MHELKLEIFWNDFKRSLATYDEMKYCIVKWGSVMDEKLWWISVALMKQHTRDLNHNHRWGFVPGFAWALKYRMIWMITSNFVKNKINSGLRGIKKRVITNNFLFPVIPGFEITLKLLNCSFNSIETIG